MRNLRAILASGSVTNTVTHGLLAHPVLKYRVPHGSQPRPGWAPDPLMVMPRPGWAPDPLMVPQQTHAVRGAAADMKHYLGPGSADTLRTNRIARRGS